MTEPAPADQMVEDLETIIRQLEALLASSSDSAGDTMQQARQQAGEALSAAKQRLAQLQEQIVNRASAALGGAREAWDAGATYLRENPWAALGIATGIGLLVGALLTRRQS